MSEKRDEIRVVYTAADVRSLYGACSRCRRMLLGLSLAPSAFLLLDLLDGERGSALIPAVFAYLIVGLCIAAGFYFVIPIVQIRARRRNQWGGPVTVSLTEAGLVIRHPAQDTRYHWAGIKKVTERRGRLFLFTTPACAVILPRPAFADDAQFESWSRQAAVYWNAAHATSA